jgi:hypothetical protein
VRRALTKDPRLRPTAYELLEHPFITGGIMRALCGDPLQRKPSAEQLLRPLPLAPAPLTRSNSHISARPPPNALKEVRAAANVADARFPAYSRSQSVDSAAMAPSQPRVYQLGPRSSTCSALGAANGGGLAPLWRRPGGDCPPSRLSRGFSASDSQGGLMLAAGGALTPRLVPRLGGGAFNSAPNLLALAGSGGGGGFSSVHMNLLATCIPEDRRRKRSLLGYLDANAFFSGDGSDGDEDEESGSVLSAPLAHAMGQMADAAASCDSAAAARLQPDGSPTAAEALGSSPRSLLMPRLWRTLAPPRGSCESLDEPLPGAAKPGACCCSGCCCGVAPAARTWREDGGLGRLFWKHC